MSGDEAKQSCCSSYCCCLELCSSL